MGVEEVRKLAATVNPDLYFSSREPDKSDKKKFVKELKEKGMGSDEVKKLVGDGKPLTTYKLIYDSNENQLEPVYFWLLDFMQDMGIKVEKITDNFTSSPGSGHFSDMGQKATVMQQQATKILADTNVLIKTILNLVYDLKEFEMRLKSYEKAKSKDKKEQEEGMLSLKNVWLDQVDMKRGRGSIHQMSYEMGFTTLREAFLVANTIDEIKNMAKENGVINDSVMRILVPRLSEFLTWKDMSEQELKKRFEIEKSYLKSEVESLKLYTKWAKPYLKAAEELRMKGFDRNASIVSAFSTTMFDLTLMGKDGKTKVPKMFGNYKMKRDYMPVFIVSLKYRGQLAQKATQRGDYAFGYGGRVEITFDCYAFNSEELKLLEKGLNDQNLSDGLSLIENNTQTSLEQLKDDIIKYTGDDPIKSKQEEKKKEADTNPFSALIDLFSGNWGTSKTQKKKEIKDVKDIEKDNFVEKEIRAEATKTAKSKLYAIYDVYKKAHGMASSPEGFDN